MLPLRRTAPSLTQNCLFVAGARGRLLSGGFAAFIKRTDKTSAPRNAPRVIVRCLPRYVGNFLKEVRHRSKHREVEFLPDVHGLQTEDLGPWSTLDPLTVRRALSQVDETYRTTLELFYVSNFSYREIGRALEIPTGTVMSRLSRGKVQLKSILLRNIYGDD